jgi:hypothetical protein
MNNLAFALSAGSLGISPDSGKRSATNSRRMEDSGILTDSGDGSLGSVLAPPYAMTGTLPVEMTFSRYHGGRLVGSIMQV